MQTETNYLPARNNRKRLWRHAVDVPLELAMVVAGLYREAAEVGAHELDELVRLALDLQSLFLAGHFELVA